MVTNTEQFHLLCIKDDVDRVESLLKADSNLVYLSDASGNTAGHICVLYRNYKMLFNLIGKYPDIVTYVNNDGDAIINLVAGLSPSDVLVKLLDILPEKYNDELNTVPYNGKTILVSALEKYLFLLDDGNTLDMQNKKIDTINLLAKLMTRGADPNVLVNNPVLHFYIDKGSDASFVELLLDHGADPNIKNKVGANALIMAVGNNKPIEIIKLLLDYDADVNYAGPDDSFLPLNIAIMKGNNEIIAILLDYNPNLSYKDRNLNMPVHNAIIAAKSVSRDNLTNMIDRSDMNVPNIYGDTPLHMLAKLKQLKKYTKLLKRKPLNLHAQNQYGETPMSYMSSHKLIDFINTVSSDILANAIRRSNTKTKYSDIEDRRSAIKAHLINHMDIYIPTIMETDNGTFAADILHNMVYLVQILKKYDGVMIPFQYMVPDKWVNDMRRIKNENLYRTSQGNLLHSIMSVYVENFFEFSPHIIIWHDKDIHYVDSNIKLYAKRLLDAPKVRFIIFKLTLVPLAAMAHANLVIYDKKKDQAERFEPYGVINYYIKDVDQLDRYIEKIIHNEISTTATYLKPQDLMPQIKLQLISNETEPENRKLGDPTGFCLAWCYWFLELKLKNPDYDTRDLISGALLKINPCNSPNPDRLNKVLQYIRGYARKLDIMKNEYLTKLGFARKLYNISYNEQDTQLLMDTLARDLATIISARIG